MARILVMDDEPMIRKMLRASLKKLGHEIVELEDGRDAARVHEEDPVDLVIADIFMPHCDGLQTIAALHRSCPELRILAISGGAANEGSMNGRSMLQAARLLGADETLEKPFGFEQIQDLVGALLPD